MRQILIAAAVGLMVTMLGTPIAIRLFRLWGWGQRIREDGPHTHLEKMGTPTMGGTVMILAIVAGYVVTRLVFTTVTAAGLSVLLATVLLVLLGFVDDYIKVRRLRSLGLSKTAKILGQALAALAGRPVRRAPALLRFHETLCFMRAYPDDPAILAEVEAALARVGDRAALILRDGSPAAARALEESAVAGTVVSCPLSLATARWLAGRFPGEVELD